MKPTPKQLNYLRTLAQRTGQTFTWPKTTAEASDEIKRLQGVKATPHADRTRERRDIQHAMATERGDAARHHADDVQGYGSTATWAHTTDAARPGNPSIGERTELGRYTANGTERVLIGQRVRGVVRLSDCPAAGERGRSFLIERGLTSKDELDAVVADYISESERRNEPAATVQVGDELAAV